MEQTKLNSKRSEIINKILVIVPSRNRAKKAKELVENWRETQTGYSDLLFVLDDDDEQLRKYPKSDDIKIYIISRVRLGPSLNKGVEKFPFYKYYGFIGDDHRFRTKGWDKMMVDKIKEKDGWGIVYGDDLYQGKNMPTAVVISANIIEVMGYMSPPRLTHLKIDRSWRELGRLTGLLFYMPEIIIEHVHPSAKKAQMDEIYKECNSKEMYKHDGLEYNRWVKEELPQIREKIKKLCFEL